MNTNTITTRPITHLTLTGYQAGRPLCDCDKLEAKARGEEFEHAMYCRDPHAPHICPACRAEWDAAE